MMMWEMQDKKFLFFDTAVLSNFAFTENGIFLEKSLSKSRSSYAGSLTRNTVITDDRTVRNFCKELQIPISGTIGILKAACLDNILEITQANRMLEQMIAHGFYSHVRQINDII